MNQDYNAIHALTRLAYRGIVGVCLLLAPSATSALADPHFASPIACTIGVDCFVQNYVDADASAGAADFTCGKLTYDGHKGTDVRLPNYVDMEKGVDVLAAASGTVLRIRDGMADINVKEIGLDAIKDRMAGNSVIIDHGDGWVTQYGHMKRGSIAVKPGQHVASGDKLGQVGLSGNTEFPHLHFEVRHHDQPIDPFTGKDLGTDCGTTEQTLWQTDVVQHLTYRPTGLLSAGYAVGVPDAEAARHGAYAGVMPTRDSMALSFWVDLFGLQKDDRLAQLVIGPDGTILARAEATVPKAKAQYFSFVGQKKPVGGWPPGRYTASFSLMHDAKIVTQNYAEIWIR